MTSRLLHCRWNSAVHVSLVVGWKLRVFLSLNPPAPASGRLASRRKRSRVLTCLPPPEANFATAVWLLFTCCSDANKAHTLFVLPHSDAQSLRVSLSFSCSLHSNLTYPRLNRGLPLLLALCLVTVGFAAMRLLALAPAQLLNHRFDSLSSSSLLFYLFICLFIIYFILFYFLLHHLPALSVPSRRSKKSCCRFPLAHLCNPDLFLCYIMQCFCCSSNTQPRDDSHRANKSSLLMSGKCVCYSYEGFC